MNKRIKKMLSLLMVLSIVVQYTFSLEVFAVYAEEVQPGSSQTQEEMIVDDTDSTDDARGAQDEAVMGEAASSAEVPDLVDGGSAADEDPGASSAQDDVTVPDEGSAQDPEDCSGGGSVLRS